MSAAAMLKAMAFGVGTGAVLYGAGSLYKQRFKRMVMEEGKWVEYVIKDHFVYPFGVLILIVGSSVGKRRFQYKKSLKPGTKPLDFKTWFMNLKD